MSEYYEFKGEYFKRIGDIEKVIPDTFTAPSLLELGEKYQIRIEKARKENMSYRKKHVFKITKEELDWGTRKTGT